MTDIVPFADPRHAPVMLDEVLAALSPDDQPLVVDGTLGAGGYTRAILQAGARVVAFDRDPTAIQSANRWAGDYGDRLVLIERPFSEMAAALADHGIEEIDGVVLDIGVSSMQLDEAARGFSFQADGPLSMRMDGAKPDAADLVNEACSEDLATIFRVYGEERFAGRLARAIVEARDEAEIKTTGRLASVILEAHPRRYEEKIHPATRVFQAIRIFVNDELGELEKALTAAVGLLRPTGRLVVVTFHSLEDRLVKRFFTARSARAGGRGSRHAPVQETTPPPLFDLPNRKPITPQRAELDRNPRARSAKLRVGIRTSTPVIPLSDVEFNTELSALAPKLSLSNAMRHWSN